MSNEKLTEAIAKAIIDHGVKNSNIWPEDYERVYKTSHGIAAAIMQSPELIAAIAPPAPHIVDTVEQLEALPFESVVLAFDGLSWQRWGRGSWACSGLRFSSTELFRKRGPFTVLHVGGAE